LIILGNIPRSVSLVADFSNPTSSTLVTEIINHAKQEWKSTEIVQNTKHLLPSDIPTPVVVGYHPQVESDNGYWVPSYILIILASVLPLVIWLWVKTLIPFCSYQN